jgi:hypothetical protein
MKTVPTMNAYTTPPKASHIPLRKKVTAKALNDFDAVMVSSSHRFGAGTDSAVALGIKVRVNSARINELAKTNPPITDFFVAPPCLALKIYL